MARETSPTQLNAGQKVFAEEIRQPDRHQCLVDLVEAGLTTEQIAKRLERTPQEIAEELARAAILPNLPPTAGGKFYWRK